MHESDAMEFIEPVLLHFMGRNFGKQEGEDPARFEPHMEKVRSFIRDDCPFWVREKALQVIYKIEEAEYSIRKGEYIPVSPAGCIDSILLYTKERIENRIAKCQNEPAMKIYHINDSPPSFPN
jgi:hypothetical protein